MKKPTLDKTLSVAALKCQLRRIIKHRQIVKTLSDSDLAEFCELSGRINASFSFEKRMRLQRKTNTERAKRRSKAASQVALARIARLKEGGSHGD